MLCTLSVLLILFQFTTPTSAKLHFVHCRCDKKYGNYTSNSTYQKNLNTLLSDLSSNTQITSGFYNLSSGTDPDIVNGIAMCRGDVLLEDCRICLQNATATIIGLCTNQKQGARLFRASCNIRYEDFKFSDAFDTIAFSTSSPSSLKAPSSPPPTLALSFRPPTPARGKGSSTTSKIVVAVVAVIVLCLFLAVIYFCLRRQRKEGKKGNNGLAQDDDINSTEALQIAYGDIKEATKDFAEANKLGRGGFGTVYKGVLANGQEIAVKRLAKNSVQGEVEFRTEVVLLAKLQHRNLVRLLGFSLAGEERLLIYEFVSNASLDHFLFGKTRNVSLDWQTRYNIIGGIARGLLYMHEDSRLRIIHRDLKASNILLDSHLNPKISDFGMARLFQADQTQADTQKIAGTIGYMAPEYTYRGIFSVKSDVYSFGVLVLEIICGKKISDSHEEDSTEDLISSVWRNWKEGTTSDVVDSALISPPRDETMKCVHIGLLCVQANPANRPTMSSVNRMLSSESLSLPQPSQPAYVLQRSLTRDPESVNAVEEESITELHPR